MATFNVNEYYCLNCTYSPEHEDFEIINSFANKMLTEATPIDEEIQNVINDHFWDML